MQAKLIRVHKKFGKIEEFKPEKIYRTCIRAGASEELAREVEREISGKVYDGITSRELLRMVIKALKARHRAVAHRYNLKESLMRLGPTGYPFENFIKHLFRLDYFNIKTGIVQNVFNKYYRNSEQDEFATDENKITKFGTDMFLNNLTLQFTKQIYKKTYLDYTVSFQKSTNLAIQSKLGIYHNFSLKIEIPYKFRLSLDYKILPFGEKNSYQIGVEKSIKFY